MDNKEKNPQKFKPLKLAAGLAYLALVGVVFYGMNDHVYDGFGKAVPWVIIVLFAAMAVIRISECIPEYSIPALIRGRLSEENEDKEENGTEE